MPNLNTDFKDDILDISNPERKYQLIYNPDGTVSLRDVTVYQQTGSLYGAKEVNDEREAINKINSDRIVSLENIDLVNQPGFFVDALAVKELNSAIKWSDWKLLGTNKLGIELRYRYNAYEVELHYKGTLKALGISGGSEGYIFPSLPEGLNPAMNIEYPIYAVDGNNSGKLALVCYPMGTPNNFRISSHSTLNVSEEYICGTVRYTRG